MVSEDHLSGHQKATIKDEIRVLEGLCNTNIRDGSAQEAYENITPSIFKEITQAVQERCPLIHEVIEALVISNQQKCNVYKTNSHKMLCGLQTLAFVVNIRNSNVRNCFPLAVCALHMVLEGTSSTCFNLWASPSTGTPCKCCTITF